MERYHIIFMGQVQGVGFRWTLCNLADMYGLTGSCENLDNGNVEVFIQGTACQEFLKEALQDRYYIYVEDYSIKKIPCVEESSFVVKH